MSGRQEGTGWWLASDGKWYPPESHPSAHPAPPISSHVTYAGFWLRVWAVLIDGLIVTVVMGILTAVLQLPGGFLSSEFHVATFLVTQAGNWLYAAVMESSTSQATIGKMALNIKVTDLEGERVSFGRASGRHFAKFVSYLTIGIGFLMAGWTQKKQALHDMMADTLVVKAPRTTP